MGKNKDLAYFLTFTNSVVLENIREYSRNRQKQKQIYGMLCLGSVFIQLGSTEVFSKTQFISKYLILSETIKIALSLLEKFKFSAKIPAAKSLKYAFKIKRKKFFSFVAPFFTLPLNIKDRKILVGFLSSYGLFEEDKKDYLDFSNFILLENIDERYLEIFSGIFINTINYPAPANYPPPTNYSAQKKHPAPANYPSSKNYLSPTSNQTSKGYLSPIWQSTIKNYQPSKATLPSKDYLPTIDDPSPNDNSPQSIVLCSKFDSAFDKFLSDIIKNSRNRNILKQYQGLATGERSTLRELSLKYDISSKRIEKIIRSELKKLSVIKEEQENQQLTLGLEIRSKDKIYYELFSLAVLLFAIIFMEHKKVYIKNTTSTISGELFLKMLFIFRLLGINVFKIAKINTYVFGAAKEAGKKIDMLIIKRGNKNFREIIDCDSIKKYISGIRHLYLSSNEIEALSSSINGYLNETSQIREIVYAALKKIKRPAHYSEITKVCGTMFKERIFTSEQIHASLTSKSQDKWVWIGLRGVYALKEWGFKRPDKGLYQTVFEIINTRFNQTAKPVPLSHIYGEIGKYRKMVNENSLYFACNFNPRIEVLKNGLFVPVIKNPEEISVGSAKGNENKKFIEDVTHKTSKKDVEFLNDLDKQFRKST